LKNKDVRAANNNISALTSTEVYNSYLYTNNARAIPYTVYEDVNGNFVVHNLNARREIEADYAWVYFSLSYF
jgi:hypothetical protein